MEAGRKEKLRLFFRNKENILPSKLEEKIHISRGSSCDLLWNWALVRQEQQEEGEHRGLLRQGPAKSVAWAEQPHHGLGSALDG